MENFQAEVGKGQKKRGKMEISGKFREKIINIEERLKFWAFLNLGLSFLPTPKAICQRTCSSDWLSIPFVSKQHLPGGHLQLKSPAQSTTAPSSHSPFRCRRLIESDGTHNNGTNDVAVFNVKNGRDTWRSRPRCSGRGLS